MTAKYKIIASLFAFSAIVCSCGKMLDGIRPKHAISIDALTDGDLDKLANGMLYQLEALNYNFIFDGDFLAENYGDGPGFTYSDVHALTESSSSEFSRSRWQEAFTKLKQANEIIKVTGASGNDKAKEVLGYALFARAYIYYQLVTRYGGVPVVDENYGKKVIPISSEADVWKFMETDLKAAAELLSPRQESFYYPTRDACNAMLAKLYLWTGEKEKAVACADEVLKNNVFKLESSDAGFASMFVSENKSTEVIFALANKRSSNFIRLFERVNDTDGSWNYAPSTECHGSLYDDNAYASDDIRKNPTFNASDPLRIIKYPNGSAAYGQFVSEPNPSNSPQVILRLADVYLAKAEALGNGVDGIKTMRTFMTHRYGNVALPDTMPDEDFMALLLDENQREFYAEGRRWFDLKRLGRTDLYKKWNGRDFLLYWPIPQNERDLAGHDNYPQNPGYTQ